MKGVNFLDFILGAFDKELAFPKAPVIRQMQEKRQMRWLFRSMRDDKLFCSGVKAEEQHRGK